MLLVCLHTKFYTLHLLGFLFSTPQTVKAKDTVDFNIKFAWHAISRMYNVRAAQFGISTSIGFVLLNIDEKNGTPATMIGPKLGLESRSLTRLLRSLEEDGLIERRADSSDKRLVRIFLTPKGKEKRDISRQTVIEFNKKVRNQLSDDKLNTFFEVIDTINKITDSQKEIYKEQKTITA